MEAVDTTTEESTNPLDTREVQLAAGRYAEACKRISALARNMGGKGLARVVTAVARFPYGESYPKFKPKSAEVELFTLMLSVQAYKGIIAKAMSDAGMNQEIEDKVVDGVVAELTEEKNNE